MRIREDAAPGDAADVVIFELSGDLVRVPIRARLADYVALIPPVAILRRKSERGAYEPINVIVKSYADDLDVSDVRLIDPPEGVRIEMVETLGKKLARVRLVCGFAMQNLDSGELHLRVAHCDVTLRLALADRTTVVEESHL